MKRTDQNWKRVSKVLDFILKQQIDVHAQGVHVVKKYKNTNSLVYFDSLGRGKKCGRKPRVAEYIDVIARGSPELPLYFCFITTSTQLGKSPLVLSYPTAKAQDCTDSYPCPVYCSWTVRLAVIALSLPVLETYQTRER